MNTIATSTLDAARDLVARLTPEDRDRLAEELVNGCEVAPEWMVPPGLGPLIREIAAAYDRGEVEVSDWKDVRQRARRAAGLSEDVGS